MTTVEPTTYSSGPGFDDEGEGDVEEGLPSNNNNNPNEQKKDYLEYDEQLREWELAQYINVFKSDGFDDVHEWFSITDEDLIEMGMKKGHRRRFLRSIEALSSSETISKNVKNSAKTLVIFGAAYGPKDVTSIVRNSMKKKKSYFQISAENSIFGDSWVKIRKSLVIVYGFIANGEILGVSTAIIAERGGSIIFDDDTPIKSVKDYSDVYVLGAGYGLEDCTSKVQSLVDKSTGAIFMKVENKVFGDGWPGVLKTLVVVYVRGGKLTAENYKQVVKVCSAKERKTLKIL